MTTWLSANSETCNTQKNKLELSLKTIDAHIFDNYFNNTLQNILPGVYLPVEVGVALVEFLDVSFLPFDIRAVLVEFSCHVIAAIFSQAEVLLCLSNC